MMLPPPDHRPPPLPLRTARLTLRPHVESDAGALAHYGDPDVTRFLQLYCLGPASIVDLVRRRAPMVAPREAGEVLALVIEHDGVVVGDVMLRLIDARGVAEVGWTLAPAHVGRGFATEAAQALVDLAFDYFGLHRVEARLDALNAASVAVCRRLGMTQEAHLRRDWWAPRGEWADTAVWAILREECG